MSCSFRSTFPLIVTLFVAHIHTAILLEYNNTLSDSHVSVTPQCYDDEHARYHPITIDCIEARQQIPLGVHLGLFHQNGPADEFRLPVIASARTCTIVIKLEDMNTDLSSWNAISFSTTTLIHTCSKGIEPEATTGGIMVVGRGKQIKIVLLKIPPVPPGLDNITESASTY